MTDWTTVAERIADDANGWVGQSFRQGVLAYAPDGSGGAWYSDDVVLPGNVFTLRVPTEPVDASDVEDALLEWDKARTSRPTDYLEDTMTTIDSRTCAFPGDQEHDHEMCHDAVMDAAGTSASTDQEATEWLRGMGYDDSEIRDVLS